MKNRSSGHSRGAPVIIVVLVVVGWVTLRGLSWEYPYGPVLEDRSASGALTWTTQLPIASRPAASNAGVVGEGGPARPQPELAMATTGGHDAKRLIAEAGLEIASPTKAHSDWSFAPAGHQILFLAALSALPVPRVAAEARADAPPRAAAFQLASSRPSERDRWTMDGWALWRQGSGITRQSGPRRPRYGGSQLGALVRYHFGSRAQAAPQAYARGYAALDGSTEVEVAMGVSARPVQTLPIRAHGEWRFVKLERGSELRPAAFVTTEIPPLTVTPSARAELYAQAGYVGGEFDSFFVDLQATGTRQVAAFDLGHLDAGVGAWIGAQRGAHRVDIGPTLRLDLRLGQRPTRLSIDWREKVTGDAEPQSGVAATISASF